MRIGKIRKTDGNYCTVAVQPNGELQDIAGILSAYLGTLSVPLPAFDCQPEQLVHGGKRLAEFLEKAVDSLSKDSDLSPFVYPADTPFVCPLRPNRVLAIGRNYGDHARELGNAIPEEPIVFMKAPDCVIGPNEPIEIPDWLGRVDFEGELLVVIGKGGRNIAESDAMDHIAAYSLFNDVTAREKQRAAQEKKQPWFLAKSFDTSGPLGPFLVTKDEVPDPHNLQLTVTVNGETKQNDTTGKMIYSIPFLIAYLSKWVALHPGDVIATGTPSGVGPIKPGDVVAVSIDGFGVLSNPVVAV